MRDDIGGYLKLLEMDPVDAEKVLCLIEAANAIQNS